MSDYSIFTLWASVRDEEPAPWMLAAEDESAWEADHERCERMFADARALADRNGWDVREIRLRVPYAGLDAAFQPAEIKAETS